jgi:micrococcal nuclease
MRRQCLLFLIGLSAAVALVSAASAPSAGNGRFALRGTVVRVVDGDTLDVRLLGGRRERIRLIGVDTPESGQCFALQAKTKARQLASGKRVRLIGEASQDTRDRYERLLAYVVLPGNRDLGRTLVSAGFGSVYVYARPFQRLAAYRAAERSAKNGGRGLWTRCAGTSPPPPPPSPPPPSPPGPPPPPVGGCAASYPDFCIPPPPPDLDCGQISGTNFRVRWDVPSPDPHRFDGDKDGIGCES